MITAAVLLVTSCLWGDVLPGRAMLRAPELRAALFVAVAFALTAFTKVSPVYILLGGAAAGLLLGFV